MTIIYILFCTAYSFGLNSDILQDDEHNYGEKLGLFLLGIIIGPFLAAYDLGKKHK